MFFYYLLFLLLLLSHLKKVVVARNKLEELNIAEKTILAEHYMRIGIQLCQYQRRLSSRNAFFAKTMEIILWPIRRDKQISNQVDDDMLVQNFLNFDGPPSSCVFSTSEWSETESVGYLFEWSYSSFINNKLAGKHESIFCEHCQFRHIFFIE